MKTLKIILIALLVPFIFMGCSEEDCGCIRTTYQDTDEMLQEEIVQVEVPCQAERELTYYNDTISYKVECD
jgi:hypothetical protein